MATKLGRVASNQKSFYTLTMWSLNFMSQTKIIIYPQPDCIGLQNWKNYNLP